MYVIMWNSYVAHVYLIMQENYLISTNYVSNYVTISRR
jgi:hypothetical protein